jgi:hypothetical protein
MAKTRRPKGEEEKKRTSSLPSKEKVLFPTPPSPSKECHHHSLILNTIIYQSQSK